MSQYYSTSSGEVAPSVTNKRVFSFLASSGTCTEAWALVAAGMNYNGPLEFRLVDAYGQARSDWTQCFSASLERVKVQGVNVVADPDGFPQVLTIEATNKSTAPHSIAKIAGVRLIYDNN